MEKNNYFGRFIKYYKPHMKLFILDMICALAVSGGDLIYPMITRSVINKHIPERNIKMLIILCGVLLLVYVMKKFLNYFIQYYGHVFAVKMQADMRHDIFKKLEGLPFKYFDDNKTGALMSRVVNDLQEISELAHHGPEDLFISAIMLIGSFALLCTINVWLALIVFVSLPVLIVFAMKKRLKMGDAFSKTRAQVAVINAGIENSISGVRVTKAFVNDEYEVSEFDKKNVSFVKVRSEAYKVMAEFSSGINFIIDFLQVVVLTSGGLFMYFGIIDFGDLTAFFLFVSAFMNPVRRLVSFVEQFQDGMSGFKRFVSILDEKEEDEDDSTTELVNVEGKIEFENVSFAYEQGLDVLKDISFKIDKGRTIAFVGPSGGGKTTICGIIPRFYEINEGKVKIDGIDITTLSRKTLRKQIGIVSQDVFLFTGTIYENIQYGRLDATREEVIKAAKKAKIHEFIENLPDGYETYVGERGIKLSGGQKQRVAIARVFLKNPPIVILDEATSALDNATEVGIQKSLEELSVGRTTVVVAHRLTTVKKADEIMVITDNKVVERGTHSELISKDGYYKELWEASNANY